MARGVARRRRIGFSKFSKKINAIESAAPGSKEPQQQKCDCHDPRRDCRKKEHPLFVGGVQHPFAGLQDVVDISSHTPNPENFHHSNWEPTTKRLVQRAVHWQRIDPTRFRIAFPHRKCRNLRSFVRPNTGNVRPVRRRDLDLQQAFGTTIAESMCFALRSVIGRSKEVRLIRLIAIAGFALPVTGCDTYAYSTAGQPDHGSRGCLWSGQDTS